MWRVQVLALFSHLLARAAGDSASPMPSKPVPHFRVDLDVEPEERFKEVMQHFRAPLQDFYKLFDSPLVKGFLRKIVEHRGQERDAELAAEVRSMAKYGGVPPLFLQAFTIVYELQTIMVPIENVTWPWGETTQRTGLEPSFGCTGILARSADGGTVTHARNLDFGFAKWFQNLVYVGTFFKGGKEVFTAQMVAGYAFPITALRRGSNGYSLEVNTRYPPKRSNVEALLKLLFEEKRTPSGWIRRQVLQSVDSFEGAVEALSTRPYASTEYNIIGGNQKGTILARDPDSVYHTQTLGPNKNDYIIITNFDFWDNDVKEWLDPTALRIGHSRRIGAERLLNQSKNIDFKELFRVMNDEEVLATDTIFQGFMNVQEDTFKPFLPNCQDCGGCTASGCAAEGEGCCGLRSYWDLECSAQHGTRRCGCLPDGACRAPDASTSRGDEDCCSYTSHESFTECPFGRRCGPPPTAAPSAQAQYV